MLSSLFEIFFILLLVMGLLANIVGLPGNWVNIGLLGLWRWAHQDMPADWWFFLFLLVLAGLAELIEFWSQVEGARRYGGTRGGTWGAFLGGIAGSIVMAPLFLGVGVLIGAVVGAFLGCLALEILAGRGLAESLHASRGALWGRVLGLVAKFGAGAYILVTGAARVWT
ncbi:MAG: DUF456 domain-containing protein [Deltaproteobacteria bacterium]|nr:DUF456 domain-containing protein [Deltaproteobacteria bacterium]